MISYIPYMIILAFTGMIMVVLGIWGFINRDRPGMLASPMLNTQITAKLIKKNRGEY